MRSVACSAALILSLAAGFAQERSQPATLDGIAARLAALEQRLEGQSSANDALAKQIDDLLWYQRVGDIAAIDKVTYTGPPPRVIPNPTGQGAGNPLIIHAYDEDVNVLEVEHLIKSLKAAGKQDKFEYKIYDAAPGGHAFNRLDTKLARDSRLEVYRFLARHLNPPRAPR